MPRACWICVTASPSANPGLRLNEIITDGSWPKWFTWSGPTAVFIRATDSSGIRRPRVRPDVEQRHRGRDRSGIAEPRAESPGTDCSARRSARPASCRRRCRAPFSTCVAVRPSDDSLSRSISTVTCGLLSCRSLLTSSKPGIWRICCSSTGAHLYSSVGVGVLHRELIQGAVLPAATEIDRRLVQHERAYAGNLVSFGRSAGDDLVHRHRALGPRLQLDEHPSGVRAAGGVVAQSARRSRRRWRCSDPSG